MTYTQPTRARPAITLALAATAMLAITSAPETAHAMAAAVDDTFAVPALTGIRTRVDRPSCSNYPPQDCGAPAGDAEDFAGRCLLDNAVATIQCPVYCTDTGSTVGPITLHCMCVAGYPQVGHNVWVCIPDHNGWPGGTEFPDEEIGDEEQEPGPEVLY